MLIVQKFGGSSVANAERVRHVAGIIADNYAEGHDIVVVLSAQGDTTDDLIEKARELNPRPSKREMDVLLSTGEQQSVALMAMALEAMGLPVVSLTGWQVGLETNTTYGSARIVRVSTERIRRELDKRRIVLVAGFQGVDKNDDITTLGRGGSDTTAVAIAATLGVSVSALKDYGVETAGDLMSLLVRLEDSFGIVPAADGSGLSLNPKAPHAPKAAMAIELWAEKRARLENGEIDADEYEDWKALL